MEAPQTAKVAPDTLETLRRWTELWVRTQRVALEALKRRAEDDDFQVPDPVVIAKAFFAWGTRALANPARLGEAGALLWWRNAALWQSWMAGEKDLPFTALEKGDRRFKDPAWSAEAPFDLIKQVYLVTSDSIQGLAREVDGLDAQTARKVEFYTRQLVDALSPSNFLLTNPAALHAALKTGGETIRKGFENLVRDMERGQGRLAIAMTNYEAFRLGENVATTPGKVIYQNDLMQLIQYAPSTEAVFRRPLLIVPPWINKYYVLDLEARNSFIRWAVAQGHTLFVISWVNPDERLSQKTFEDYMSEGPLAALEAIEAATAEREVNVVGYCIGGTLTAALLAWMAVKGDARVRSAAFLTTLVDFADPGEISVFIDEGQLGALEKHMRARGYLEGRHMATVFNLLRANDLIWFFAVNNYLLGRDPIAFDLLYWNSDATRMPVMMHEFYLRNMYQRNRLVEPGGITLLGVPIDLRKIEIPTYILATREDHIAPWRSAYAATQRYAGPIKFVLSASGHIAGVINPPAANKYGYWTNPNLPADPELWLDNAVVHQGSWWPDWAEWLCELGGDKVPARFPGGGALKPIEDAPGSYVKVRLSEGA